MPVDSTDVPMRQQKGNHGPQDCVSYVDHDAWSLAVKSFGLKGVEKSLSLVFILKSHIMYISFMIHYSSQSLVQNSRFLTCA